MTKKILLVLLACVLTFGVLALCACGGGHEHTYSWKSDGDYHWREPECDDITGKTDLGAHQFVGAKCSVCDYTLADTQGLVFELNQDGNSYAITGVGSVTAETIVVPATYNGKPVTVVADKAFYAINVVTLILPDSITEIGEYAFADCIHLTRIYIPEGVKSIGYMALMDCTSLPEVTLPSTLEHIGGSLVFYSRALKVLRFAGTKAQWESISKDGWNYGVTVSVVTCSDGTVAAK